MQFMNIILDISNRYQIQLFVTSCSSHVLKNFEPKCYLMTSEKQVITGSWIDNAAARDLLGIHNDSIVITCDGDTDSKFFTKILKLMKIKMNNILFYSNTSIIPAIDILQKHYQNVTVIVTHDRELKLDPLSELQQEESSRINLAADQIFFWELPCIESYVVAFYYLEVDQSIFEYTNDQNEKVCWLESKEIWIEFETIYAKGIYAISGNKKGYCHILNNPWRDGLVLIEKIKSFQVLTKDEIFTVVKVLHGHTLVKYINLFKKISYSKMLGFVDEKITKYPGMDTLKGMIEKC